MMGNLHGKTLIVTGASSGIGRALSTQMAKAGANLALNARREELLAEVTQACSDQGIRAEYIAGDASNSGVAQSLVAMALRLENFHGFVHCAGVLQPGPYLWELSQDHFQEIMGASLTAAFQLIRHAVPEIINGGAGVCVFIGSGAAELTMPGISAYCVAKAAEEHLMRQLAAEAPQITSLVYRPGVVDTDMQRLAREAEGGAAKLLHREFQAYKDQKMLISPSEAAGPLVRILDSNPRKYHGKICNWSNLV
jgi:NAD(P)-dependent dehydrogenase (short-subunit alcohol dehydrogenase family)